MSHLDLLLTSYGLIEQKGKLRKNFDALRGCVNARLSLSTNKWICSLDLSSENAGEDFWRFALFVARSLSRFVIFFRNNLVSYFLTLSETNSYHRIKNKKAASCHQKTNYWASTRTVGWRKCVTHKWSNRMLNQGSPSSRQCAQSPTICPVCTARRQAIHSTNDACQSLVLRFKEPTEPDDVLWRFFRVGSIVSCLLFDNLIRNFAFPSGLSWKVHGQNPLRFVRWHWGWYVGSRLTKNNNNNNDDDDDVNNTAQRLCIQASK